MFCYGSCASGSRLTQTLRGASDPVRPGLLYKLIRLNIIRWPPVPNRGLRHRFISGPGITA